MLLKEFEKVLDVVEYNINQLKATNGLSLIDGLEGFTEEMLNMFDDLYDIECTKLSNN